MSDAEPILDLIEAFRRSKTMFTAVSLGIFDQLASGPLPAAAIALEARVHLGACGRLLNACVSLQLLRREGENYANTQLANRYLVSSSPHTLCGYILYSDASLYRLWGRLEDAVREGTNRWAQVFGSREALFDHYFRDEAATAAFLEGMHGFGQLASPRVVRAFDLSRYGHLVDLGGATGHLAIAACEAYPDLRATVIDLPRVAPFARRIVAKSSVADRIRILSGDFFKDDLPSADLYYLGRIIHDWSESSTVPLLARIYSALPAHGALLIGETLVNDDCSGPVYSLMQDLNMLVCTDGRERTRAEYRELLANSGFTRVEFQNTGALLDAILAVKS